MGKRDGKGIFLSGGGLKLMKNKKCQKILSVLMGVLSLAFGAILGVIIVSYVEWELALGEYFLMLAANIIAVTAIYFLQIIIHEGGHLIFGLISGYRFNSFRIGSVIVTKEGGKLRLGSYSLAGTAGQCLMYPPEEKEKIPYVLYNLGGVITNLVASAAFFAIWLAFPAVSVLSPALLGGALIGVYTAVTNGVPMQVGMVNNDGLNAASLGNDEHALRSFACQLRVNARMARGERLRDMPRELFELAEGADGGNPINAVIKVFACNRLVDEHRFAEARTLCEALIADEAVIPIYKNMLTCDLAFCEMMAGECDRAASRFNAELTKFFALMPKNPSIVRTRYAHALLCERNAEKAGAYKSDFEKLAKSYPYKGDIESERELILEAERAVNA
jgi:hypothetical protein